MLRKTYISLVLSFCCLAASAETASFKDSYQTGKAQQQSGNYEQARILFEQAVKLAANTQEKVDAQMAIGMTYNNEYDRNLSLAQRSYSDARLAYARILDIPEVSPGQRWAAQSAMINTLFSAKRYADVQAEMKNILESKDLSPSSKAYARFTLGKSYLMERNYAAARVELAEAIALEGISGSDKPQIQLYIGCCDYEMRNYELAKQELQTVLTMPGAYEHQIHEAKLKLNLIKPVPEGEKMITVLFIGASHTQVGPIPQMVEGLAASAPVGRPRIITGGFLRGGTMINRFWEEGAGPDTARGVITADPWDFVVVETFFTMSHDDLIKYGALFTDLIRRGGSNPVFYESIAGYAKPYPDTFQKFHDENIALGKTLKTPVAPCMLAWMLYLGANPTQEQRKALYGSDAVHTSPPGAYMAACCIYSAITGLSPVGLAAPDSIPQSEVQALQEAAWKAVQETNPGLKGLL